MQLLRAHQIYNQGVNTAIQQLRDHQLYCIGVNSSVQQVKEYQVEAGCCSSILTMSFDSTPFTATGYTVTNHGSVSLNTTDQLTGGGCASFNGTNSSRLSIEDNDAFTMEQDFSIKLAIRTTSSGTWQSFFSNITLAAQSWANGIDFYINSQVVKATLYDDYLNMTNLVGTTILSDNTWYEVELRREGTIVSLLVNNVVEDSDTFIYALNAKGITLGNAWDTATRGFTGLIDNFEINTCDMYNMKSILIAAVADSGTTKSWPTYDISETSFSTWDDYFQEYGQRNSIYYAWSPNAVVSTGNLLTETVPFDTSFDYDIFGYCASWANDEANASLEFKDSSNNVIFAITLDSLGSNYCERMFYGPTLSSLTQATNSGTLNSIVYGILAFSPTEISFTPNVIYPYEHTLAWSASVDTTTITQVTISNVRAVSNYTGGTGGAMVKFNKHYYL